LVEANTTHEVSHEGGRIILQFKNSIEADQYPLDEGGNSITKGGSNSEIFVLRILGN